MILAAFVMAPALTAREAILRSWERPVLVAHRGGAAERPENTLDAYRHAITTGAELFETDIHLSRDGEMVVMHDGTLDRTTTLKGKVVERPWSEMAAAGIPRLADLYGVTRGKGVTIVEIKAGEGVEEKLVDYLRTEKLGEETIVFGFDRTRVAKVKTLDPKLVGVWLVAAKVEDPAALVADAKRSGFDGIGVSYKNLPDALPAAARAEKLPLFVWTVPPGPEIARLKRLRVNFVITDHPTAVRDELARP